MEVISTHNALRPQDGLQRHEYEYDPYDTLDVLVDKLWGRPLDDSVLVFVNGIHIPNEYVNGYHLAEKDLVSIQQGVQGGGNGTASKAVVVIAAIALIASGNPAGAAAASSAGLTGTTAGAFLASAVAVSMTVAGSYLLSTVFQPTTPDLSGNEYNTSPSGSIENIQNRPRWKMPIPIIVGTHRLVPDLSAKLYSVYEGEDQYAHGIFTFCINSDVEVTDLKLGEADIDDFDDVEYELSTSDTGSLNLFPGNVDTTLVNSSCETLEIRTTATSQTRLVLAFSGILVRYNKKGQQRNHEVYFNAQYRESTGPGPWKEFVNTGSNPADFGDITFNNGSQKLYRKTFSIAVDEGQYDVKVIRVSPIENDPQRLSSISWESLVSYAPDDQSIYAFQKRLAVRVKAQGSLQGQIDAVNAIVSAKVPVGNSDSPLTFTTQTSSNPGWIFLWMAKGATDGSGRRLYGGGLVDSEIDIAGIEEWADWCDSKGPLTCDHVFDQKISLYDALTLIARTGRARVDWSSGKLGVVYDNEALPISQIFNESNILRDTLKVEYASEVLVDGAEVTYLNAANGYHEDVVNMNLPGTVNPTNVIQFRIPGITSTTNAGREGLLIMAEQYYRGYKRISFSTSMEYLTAKVGNVISVQNSLVDFDIAGRLDPTYAHTTSTIKLDRPVGFSGSTTAQIRLRHPDNTIDLRNVVTPVGVSPLEAQIITLSSPLSQNPSAYANNNPEDTIYNFSAEQEPGEKYKIISIQPTDFDGVEAKIVAVPETDDYYNFESGGSYNAISASLFNTGLATVSNVTVAEEQLASDSQILVSVSYDLENAVGVYASYTLHKGSNTAAQTEIYLGEIKAKRFEFQIQEPSTITIKLRTIPTNPARFKPTTTVETVAILGIFLGNDGLGRPIMPVPTGLELYEEGTDGDGEPIGKGNDTEFTSGTAKFRWRRVAIDTPEKGNEYATSGVDTESEDPFFSAYQCEVYDLDDNLLRRVQTKENFFHYSYDMNWQDNGGIPDREFRLEVRTLGKQGQLSNAARLTVSNPPPGDLLALSLVPTFHSINIDYRMPGEDEDEVGMIAWLDTSSGFTPSGNEPGIGNCVFKGTDFSAFVTDLLSGTDYYIVAAAYDQFGSNPANLNLSSELTAQTADVSVDLTDIDDIVWNGLLLRSGGGSPNLVEWDACTLDYYDAGTETTTTYTVDAGSLTYSGSGSDYIYVDIGSPTTLYISATNPGVATNRQIVARWAGGTDIRGTNGDAFIDGANVYAATVQATQLAAGSVLADKIGANQVTANAMATNSITAANGALDNLVVTSGKIGSLAVTTGKINLLAVDSAQIANAAIQNAKIDTAAVTTLKVGTQQITIPGGAQQSSSFNPVWCTACAGSPKYSSGTYVTLCSTSMANTGAPVNVVYAASWAHGGASGVAVYLSMWEDATLIQEILISTSTATSVNGKFCFTIQHTPAVATNTWYLKGRITYPAGGNGGFSSGSFIALETKR